METETNFKNAGEPWLQDEDDQLNELYNVGMLDITEISNINNRSPGQIISRLCAHNYIPNRTSARGYNDYKNSDYYKAIVSAGEAKKKLAREEKSQNPDKEYPSNTGQKWTDAEDKMLLTELKQNIDIDTISQNHNRTIGGINKRLKRIAHKMVDKNISLESEIVEIKNDVKEMKKEIIELKSTIKELVEMMKAVYEFEDA